MTSNVNDVLVSQYKKDWRHDKRKFTFNKMSTGRSVTRTKKYLTPTEQLAFSKVKDSLSQF